MALLNEDDSMEEALRFDVEFARFQQEQKRQLQNFVKLRMPKTNHEDFNEEARIFVTAGGSFAYILARRGGVVRESQR